MKTGCNCSHQHEDEDMNEQTITYPPFAEIRTDVFKLTETCSVAELEAALKIEQVHHRHVSLTRYLRSRRQAAK
jgi:hypothetical protein